MTDAISENKCVYCGCDDGHNEVCIAVQLERWKANYQTLLDDCIQRRTDIERLRATIQEALEAMAASYTYRGGYNGALEILRKALPQEYDAATHAALVARSTL